MTKTMITSKIRKSGLGAIAEKANAGFSQCVNVYFDKEESLSGDEPAFVLNYDSKDSWVMMNCYGTSKINGVRCNTEEVIEALNNWKTEESNRR